MKVALVHDWLTGMRGGEKVLPAGDLQSEWMVNQREDGGDRPFAPPYDLQIFLLKKRE